MKYDFIILGADGMQGDIVIRDLLKQGYTVFAADLYKTRIKKILQRTSPKKIRFSFIDLRNIDAIAALLKKKKSDIVINCADMYWNLNVYKACATTRKHCVDLGSWVELTERQLATHKLFKAIGRTAITGCGSVPGIGNVMLRYAAQKFDRITGINVGFAWDYNQKKFVVPFSMKSILEEFTYSPRFIKHGKWVKIKPLAISIRRKFKLIGYQQSFLVYHPELYTFYRYYKDKGVQNIRFFAGFPGHSLEKIYSLIDLGFHSDKPVAIKEFGVRVAPFDLLNPVLKRLGSPVGYTESENLWVEIKGIKNKKSPASPSKAGRAKTILMECLVPPAKGWEEAGCNIDTGFPAVIIAKMIKDGIIQERGSFAPETVVPEKEFFEELAKKKLRVYENGRAIN